jgi:hypothetical protein
MPKSLRLSKIVYWVGWKPSVAIARLMLIYWVSFAYPGSIRISPLAIRIPDTSRIGIGYPKATQRIGKGRNIYQQMIVKF